MAKNPNSAMKVPKVKAAKVHAPKKVKKVRPAAVSVTRGGKTRMVRPKAVADQH